MAKLAPKTSILPFSVVDRCRNHLATLLSSSPLSKMPDLPLEFRRYLSQFQRYEYFRYQQPFPVVGHFWNRLRTLFQLVEVENPRFAVGILTLSVILSEI